MKSRQNGHEKMKKCVAVVSLLVFVLWIGRIAAAEPVILDMSTSPLDEGWWDTAHGGNSSVSEGILTINSPGAYHFGAPFEYGNLGDHSFRNTANYSIGWTIETRMRHLLSSEEYLDEEAPTCCNFRGGSRILIEDDGSDNWFVLLSDRIGIELPEFGLAKQFFVDTTEFHTYRIEGKGDYVSVFVDEELAIDYTRTNYHGSPGDGKLIFGDGDVVGHTVSEWDFFSYDLIHDAMITPDFDYYMDITLSDTFTFDYWWEMGLEPEGFNVDILFFRDGEWQFLGWELNFDGRSTEWEKASFLVPPWARGLETQIMFRVFDFGESTFPRVYLNNIRSESVPEPSTLLLIGTGLLGLIGFRRLRK